MKKILIIGSTGMLGNTLNEYFSKLSYNIKTLNRSDLDLSKCSDRELETKIIDSECDILINCAGLIKQRKGTTTADFIAVNSLLPHRMADICKTQDKKLIHITTDCVYSGVDGQYTEESKHDIFDDYGKSKSMGEPENCTVIRTSIIGEEKSNKLSLLEWVKSMEKKEINGYKNHKWNGLTCLQVGKLMNKIIVDGSYWAGVRHFHSNEVNKYDLVSMINEIYNLNIKITPMDDNISVDRTLNSIHNIDKFKIPNLYKQIEETRDFHDGIKKIHLEDVE